MAINHCCGRIRFSHDRIIDQRRFVGSFFRRSTTNPSQRRADAKTIADPKTIDIRCVLHGPSKLCLFRLAALCAHIQGRAHVLQILAQRQGGACAYAAITGGLIGISIPFVFVYAFVGVISAQSADEGVKGISLPDGLLASPYKLVPASSEGVKCNRSS